jgi:predicted nucleotidyltransferase
VNPEDQKIVDQIKKTLKEKYKPLRLFLYGSRANGSARPDSDYDFVMVLSEFDSKNQYELMSSITSTLRNELDVEVQVWTYSEYDFLDWKDEFSSIPETALNTGLELSLG